jgi:hypothetical protein
VFFFAQTVVVVTSDVFYSSTALSNNLCVFFAQTHKIRCMRLPTPDFASDTHS